MNHFQQDKNAILDYKFDWSECLQPGETISSQTCTASSGLTVNNSDITDGGKSVTVWLSGSAAGLYSVTNRIATSAGREDDRTMTIAVLEK